MNDPNFDAILEEMGKLAGNLGHLRGLVATGRVAAGPALKLIATFEAHVLSSLKEFENEPEKLALIQPLVDKIAQVRAELNGKVS